jgi:hypothetical protein
LLEPLAGGARPSPALGPGEGGRQPPTHQGTWGEAVQRRGGQGGTAGERGAGAMSKRGVRGVQARRVRWEAPAGVGCGACDVAFIPNPPLGPAALLAAHMQKE